MSAQTKKSGSLMALLLLLLPCALVASEQSPDKPLLVPLKDDPKTSLFTMSGKNGASLVVDLAGSLVWSTCPSTHSTVPCQSDTCQTADQQQRPRRCRYVDPGPFWANREPTSQRGCACTGHPVNPVTGECSAGDLTSFAMSANATEGREPLYPVDLSVVGSCAPERLSRSSLPAGATGVAGLARSPLSLTSQLSSQRKFGNVFALCLPGFAVFGNTSIWRGPHLPDLTSIIYYTPLVVNPRSGAYHLTVKGIRVGWSDGGVDVLLPAGALDLDLDTGRGGVVFSTTTPYMIMRSDVYRSFSQAYDKVMLGNKYNSRVKRVPAVPPFDLCYDVGDFLPRHAPHSDGDAAWISLILGTKLRWPVPVESHLVYVGGTVVCAGVVEMGRAAAWGSATPVEDEPAVVIGLKQMTERLLVFDLDRGMLGFSDLLWQMNTACIAFNLQ